MSRHLLALAFVLGSVHAARADDLEPVDTCDFDCQDRKSTRLNSSHQIISYAVFCLKKKTTEISIILARASKGNTTAASATSTRWASRCTLVCARGLPQSRLPTPAQALATPFRSHTP